MWNPWLLVAEAGVAAVWDLRCKKISNRYLAILLLGNLALCAKEGTLFAVPSGLAVLAGMGLPLVLFPLFVFRAIGAADVKLLMVLGLGLQEKIVPCMGYALLFGGVWALVRMVRRRMLGKRFRVLFEYLLEEHSLAEGRHYGNFAGEGAENLPLAPAVFFSVLLYAGGVY